MFEIEIKEDGHNEQEYKQMYPRLCKILDALRCPLRELPKDSRYGNGEEETRGVSWLFPSLYLLVNSLTALEMIDSMRSSSMSPSKEETTTIRLRKTSMLLLTRRDGGYEVSLSASMRFSWSVRACKYFVLTVSRTCTGQFSLEVAVSLKTSFSLALYALLDMLLVVKTFNILSLNSRLVRDRNQPRATSFAA